jgi:hypothetical protein
VPSGERIVAAKPSAGEALCIVDLPATGDGPQYLVEPRVEVDGVKALVDDYVSQALQLGEVPMRTRS